MNLDTGAATVLVGGVAVLVAAWGAWFSSRSSRDGPRWARDHLGRWRLAPWLLGLLGLGATMAFDPVWPGLGVLYIAAVTGFLMRQVRRRLEAVERAYGPFEEGLAARSSAPRMGFYLMGGGTVLALLGVADVAVRGWSGAFALALAGILVMAGLFVRGK